MEWSKERVRERERDRELNLSDGASLCFSLHQISRICDTTAVAFPAAGGWCNKSCRMFLLLSVQYLDKCLFAISRVNSRFNMCLFAFNGWIFTICLQQSTFSPTPSQQRTALAYLTFTRQRERHE